MRLLLDTHFLLWLAEGSPRLSKQVVREVEDAGNDVLFSAASIWEVAIKVSRRPNFGITAGLLRHYLLDNGYATGRDR